MIPKGVVELSLTVTFEISDTKRRYSDRLKDIIKVNYDDSFVSKSFDITAIKNSVEEDMSEVDKENNHHLIDDEVRDNDIICVD